MRDLKGVLGGDPRVRHRGVVLATSHHPTSDASDTVEQGSRAAAGAAGPIRIHG
jgi:hypothetical protein